jgi:hypothetical protein
LGELTAAIVGHALLGVGLAVVVWGLGIALLALAAPGRPIGRREALDAYPLGLVACSGGAVAVLLSPWAGAVAATAAAGAVVAALVRRPAIDRDVVHALWPLAAALPAAGAFAVTLGFLQHGPTETLESAANGELQFYVMKLISASQSIAPYRDLLVEGQEVIYAEGAPSFVGAALAHLPGFDPFLYHTTTLGLFAVVSLVFGLRLAVGDRPALGPYGALAVAALALAFLAYPSWVAESPPVAFAAALGFGVHRLLVDELSGRRIAALTSLLLLACLATKVLAAIPLAVVLVFVVWRRYRDHPNARRIATYAALGLSVAAVAAIALLFLTAGWYADLVRLEFLPAEAVDGLLGDRSREDVAFVTLTLGEIALAVLLARLRCWALLTALGAAVLANWVIGGYGFDIAVGVPILVAALELARRPDVLRAHPLIVGAAAILLAVSVWLRDLHGTEAGLVLTLLAGAALLIAVAPTFRQAHRLAYVLAAVGSAVVLALADLVVLAIIVVAVLGVVPLTRGWRARIVVPAAAILAAVVAASAGAARADDLALTRPTPVLTPFDHDIWGRVRETVPEDGLVFTSLTGRAVTPHEGWNNYPAVSERQVYLAGWYDGRLVARPEELEQRLGRNDSVLTGRAAPASIDVDRTFDGYYAVLRLSDPVPGSFLRVYANEVYALYRLRS